MAFCEIEPFCQKVLKKHWPEVPIYNDVRTLDYDGAVDLICGGFPCQPFSVAGKRKGAEDDRHLWPAMFDLVKKYRPRWVIGENVAGLINMGLDCVLADLESEGYTTRTFVIPACAVGAPHRRDRLWIIGYAEHDGLPTTEKPGRTRKANDDSAEGQDKTSKPSGWDSMATNAENERCQGAPTGQIQGKWNRILEFMRKVKRNKGLWNLPSSRVCGSNDGISDRSHRLRSLGNAVVPQIPEIIGHAIIQAHDHPSQNPNR